MKKKRHRWEYPVPYARVSISKPAICLSCGALLWNQDSARKSTRWGGSGYITMVQMPCAEPVPYSQVPGCRPKRRAA